ncbi:MAG: HAMP domain-containing methyl-accepting chemotaxis protein [Acidaminobacteraceae bacterium]
MRNLNFKSKIMLIAVILLVVSNSALTFMGVQNTEKMALKDMREQAFIIAEEVNMKLKTAETFSKTLDTFLGNTILLASESINYTDSANWSNEYFIDMAKSLDVTEINVIAPNRKIVYSNIVDYIDWEYPSGHAMDIIFNGSSKTYMEDVRENPIDKKLYKYGGIALENGYYVQVGIAADEIDTVKKDFSTDMILLEEEREKEIVLYAVLIDENGTAINGTESMIGITYTDEVTLNAIKGTPGAAYWVDETTGVAAYDVQVPYYSNGKAIGSIAIGISLEMMEVAIASYVRTSIILIIIAIFVSLVILYVLSTFLVKPLKNLAINMQSMANGDFAIVIDSAILTKKDEIGDIANALDRMKQDLKHLISSIISDSSKLSESSTSLSKIMSETATAVDENSRAIESLAQTATDQVATAEDMANSSKSLGDEIDNSKSLINLANESVQLASKHSENGQVKIKNLEMIAKDSLEKASNIESGVLEVDNAIEDMVNFVDTISAISSQTNLLALNASIEAARAGESGKGFAVVAEEIRKLSVETDSATQKVNEIILNVKDKANISVNEAKEVKTIAEEQSNVLGNVTESFTEINNSLSELIGKMDGVMSSTEMVNDMKNKILSATEKLAEMTSDVSATYEEISASTEEQTASIQEVSALAEVNMTLAETLIDQVKVFKI